MIKARLLIVEDEFIIAMELQDRLKQMGYEITAVAGSGQVAIEKTKELKPDLILMDIQLQGDMDGIAAATQIRRHRRLPIIYVTAFADDKTLQRAKVTEPFGYVLKPFDERELQITIDMALYKHRMEEKFIQTERLAALGRLAAALAHEINNPLQAMQSHLELVRDYLLPPEETKERLQIIEREIIRLRETSQRILGFAEPGPGVDEWVSVVELAQRTLLLAEKQLQQREMVVTTDWQPVPLVLASPHQLTQVFLNLILNAVEAAPGGRLNVATAVANNTVTISFTNNGPPIPSGDLGRIFEPFYTTKANGSGLGLWVSHSLVQRFGGTLTARNLPTQPGANAAHVTFTIRLPASSPPNPN